MILDKDQALECMAGGITASLISAINSLFKTIYSIGQDFGYSLKRAFNRC